MSIAEALLPEYDHEMATTRRLLERVPEDNPDWRPHAKSFPISALALHVAEMPVWATTTLQNTELDMSPADGGGYKRPAWESRAALLKFFDDNVATARAQIAKTSDAEFMVGWTLKNAGQALFTMPRVAVVRTWVMNHTLHHRGQLSVYLRLLDVPVPSIYGPSADEQGGM